MAVAVLLGIACDDAQDRQAQSRSVCEEAAEVIEACTGERPSVPDEGCVGEFADSSSAIVEGGCEALASDGGKADADGFWCHSSVRWLGLCEDEVSLQDAVAVATVQDVCAGRSDALCSALRDDEVAQAREVVAARVASEPREDVTGDPAVRLYLRDRISGLLAFHVVGRSSPGGDYAAQVDDVLAEHFPGYPPGTFPLARQWSPPAVEGCDAPTAAIVFFPGVVRFVARDEFTEQRQAIEAALPCVMTHVVDTGSFIEPRINAQQAVTELSRIDEVQPGAPLHLVGYSQGSSSALRTLVDSDEFAARTVTMMGMNSAAHGSEVADTLGDIVMASCDSVPTFARPTCEWAAEQSAQPTDFLLQTIARAMSIPVDQIEEFIAAEDDIVGVETLADFFAARAPGIGSLTTGVASQFWAERGDELPRTTLYYSFRSIVTDEDANLPPSNALFFALLERAGESAPHNDMQVRLENQSYGGPIADREIVGPAAEGNHWQWELATGAVPAAVMPPDMTDRIPHRELLVAYFEALAEVGLLDPP